MTVRHNPFAFNQPITLDSLPDLFAHHRARLGGLFMEDDGADKGGDGGDSGKSDDGDKGKGDFKPITSQDEFDRALSARLAREREKFADYDDLKAAKVEYDKLLDAAKSEQEKAVEAARNEGKTEALTVANDRLIAAEARALAAEAKFASPAVVVRAIDLSGVKVNADGSVDTAAIKAKLDEAKESGGFVINDGPSKPRSDKSQGGGGTDDAPSVSRGRERYAEKHKKAS